MTTTKVRLTFLPVFLTLLSIAFTVALAMRIRSYRAMEAAAPAVSAPSDGASASDASGSDVALAGGAESARLPDGLKPAGIAPAVVTQTVSREQRYRELLALGNSPQDAAVKTAAEAQAAAKRALPAKPPQPQPQPSALSRLLQPLVNAVTGGQRQPGAQPGGSGGQNKPATPPSSDTPRKSEEPKDPNSDTTPPQLLGIEFQPNTIHDGEDTTLIITATDDMSGIRGISGTLTSPTGKALQGFAQQRDGDPSLNRYVSKITIPKDAEEGTWKISFLNMSDNATNMITLTYAQGTIPPTAVLKVLSSSSDNTPPTLRSATVAKRAMHSGEPNTLYVDCDDDKSGVRLVSAVFVSPSKNARLGFGCKQGDGTTWECSMNVPDCLDCGDWSLEQVQMQDKANNYVTVRQDNPIVAAVKVNIAGNSCDNTPPVLQNLTLDKNLVIMGQGDPSVTIRVTVTDDTCGIGGLSGQVVGPGTNAGTFFAFSPEGGDGTSWIGTFRLSPQAPRGLWKIQSITVNDKGQNLRIYYSSDPVLARGQFVVK